MILDTFWTNTEDYQTNTPQVNWGISEDTIINLELKWSVPKQRKIWL